MKYYLYTTGSFSNAFSADDKTNQYEWNRSTGRKSRHNATLSTTNHILHSEIKAGPPCWQTACLLDCLDYRQLTHCVPAFSGNKQVR
jgi:hypothetical protein